MDRLEEALQIFGEEYIEEMAKILRKQDKIASGDLIRSLDTRVLKTGFGTSYTLKILAEEYLKYIESGRKPNSKAPPVEDENGDGILKWTRQKGIPEGLAYPIAKSIGIKGIKPVDVIAKAFDQVTRSIEFRRLENGVSDWVDDLISEKLKGLSKNKNITFK